MTLPTRSSTQQQLHKPIIMDPTKVQQKVLKPIYKAPSVTGLAYRSWKLTHMPLRL